MVDKTHGGIFLSERGSSGNDNGIGIVRQPVAPRISPIPVHANLGRTTIP
jgi:hypothetical protein